MSTEAVPLRESLEQRVMSFIKDMKAIRFDGPTRGKFDLDTFLLLTYNQGANKDEIEFASWAIDSSRIYPDYIKTVLSYLKLPEKKDHPPYPRTDMQYYEDNMPKEGKKVPVIALGIGPTGRTFLFRLKGMSTKNSFERLRKAAGV